MSTQLSYAVEAAMLTNAQYRRFFALDVCSDLDGEERADLYSCFEPCRVAAGNTIYEAGSESNREFFLITQGSAAVSTAGENVYAKLNAGDSFGLYSFLDAERKHSATVRAISDLELLRIGREHFDLITLEEPELGNRVLRFMFHLLSDHALQREHEYAALHSYMTNRRF